jgi:hypothetical protein
VNSKIASVADRPSAARDEHGPRHVTPAGRSVFYDLFPKAEAEELGPGVGYQARQDRAVQPGHARPLSIAGQTQAQSEIHAAPFES